QLRAARIGGALHTSRRAHRAHGARGRGDHAGDAKRPAALEAHAARPWREPPRARLAAGRDAAAACRSQHRANTLPAEAARLSTTTARAPAGLRLQREPRATVASSIRRFLAEWSCLSSPELPEAWRPAPTRRPLITKDNRKARSFQGLSPLWLEP